MGFAVGELGHKTTRGFIDGDGIWRRRGDFDLAADVAGVLLDLARGWTLAGSATVATHDTPGLAEVLDEAGDVEKIVLVEFQAAGLALAEAAGIGDSLI